MSPEMGGGELQFPSAHRSRTTTPISPEAGALLATHRGLCWHSLGLLLSLRDLSGILEGVPRMPGQAGQLLHGTSISGSALGGDTP